MLVEPMTAAAASNPGLEFPVIMRQKVEAGKTPVGTKVEARLTVATLVNGVVVPEGAVLSGEVTESVAKSAAGPSHLAIRVDTARWKKGATPTVLELTPKPYLTSWIYPSSPTTIRDSSNDMSDPTDPLRRTHSSPPFPGTGRGGISDTIPERPGSGSSNHRVPMKDVESTRNSDGGVTLTSQRSNIKLDKSTTYVLAAGDLGAAK